MNNKDLFNAINNIDDKFITDAGRYLKNDESFISSHYADPADAYSSDRKFSLMKLIAPITAAAVLICSITIALKMRALYPALNTDIAVDESENTGATGDKNDTSDIITDSEAAADKENSQELSGSSTKWEADTGKLPGFAETAKTPELDDNGEPVGNLPFTLYGPDGQQIKYEEVTRITENVSKQYLSDSNWVQITCNDFAYIGTAQGMNFNRADDPQLFDGGEIPYDVGDRNFRRIYVGGVYGALTVQNAYSTFWRTPTNGMTEQQMRENGMPLSLLYRGSYLELDGMVTVDAYIVRNDEGRYMCVLRSGETQIPTMNIEVKDDGSFGSYLYSDGEADFEYKTELPRILLDLPAEEERRLDSLFEKKSYQKARVVLSDIVISYDAASQYRYQISAAAAVEDIQRGDSDIEPGDVSALIKRSLTVEDLEKEVISLYNEISEVHVYYEAEDIYNDVIIGPEQTEGELQTGMTVGLYDRNGLVGIYTYKQK